MLSQPLLCVAFGTSITLFAAADKFFYQKRRNNLVVAADIMSLRNFRELFPITFQIKRFIQRRNFLVLCPGQMVEVAGNGYDFLNVESRFGGGNKPRRLGAAGKTDQNDRRIAGQSAARRHIPH